VAFPKYCALALILAFALTAVPQECASAQSAEFQLTADFQKYFPGDGTPFAISINFSGEKETEYKMSVWIYGGKNSTYLSKVWNGTKWLGGTGYYITIITDKDGGWSGIVPMEIIKMPDAGYDYYLKLSVKDCVYQKIYGEGNFSIIPKSDCGWVEGYAERDGIYLSGEVVEAFAGSAATGGNDRNGAPAGRCISENNGIDENYKEFAGYFRFALPAGNYTIKYSGGAFWNVPVVAGKTAALNNRTFSFVVHNVTAFVSPDCYFDALSSALQSAKESISINIYEFTSPFLYDIVAEMANCNVSVRILAEGSPVGGMKESEKWILNSLASLGCEVRFWKKPKGSVYDHAKYAVIDNRSVVVGSANWGATGVPKDNTFGNREWGIVLRDEKVARGLLDVFEYDWATAEKAKLDAGKEPARTAAHGAYEPSFVPENFNGNFNARLVFSPENSREEIIRLIRSATDTIFVEQLYIYTYWDNKQSPLVSELINASARGVEVRVILNYNKMYESSYAAYDPKSSEKVAAYLREHSNHSISVKLFETGEKSIFANVHNKGVIVDNRSVLVSSINWNENSVCNNREVGVIIDSEAAAQYYADAFFRDWNMTEKSAAGAGEDGGIEKQGKMPDMGTAGIVFALLIAMPCASVLGGCGARRARRGRR